MHNNNPIENDNHRQYRKYNTHRATILSWMPPTLLFICGLIAFVPYILTQSLLFRSIQVIVFFLFASQIKHVRVWYFIMITATVTFFHLLVPNGKVLLEYSFLRITEGALHEGLFRGLTLNGCVFLSVWCISQKLTLPTKYGRLLSLSVRYFDLIISVSTSNKYRAYIKAERTKNKNNNKAEKNSWTRFKLSDRLAQQTDILLATVISHIQKNETIDGQTAGHTEHTIKTARDKNSTKYQKIIGMLFLVTAIGVAWSGLFIK